MTEAFLHYIWKNRLFNFNNLKTVDGQEVEIVSPGKHNTNSGPDFFNGQVRIGGTLWAGNIEIHILSSDWFKHNHQKDPAYDSCILHVVYENDGLTRRMDGSIIPEVELKGRYPDYLWNNFIALIAENSWVPCSHRIHEVNESTWNTLYDKMAHEKLQKKSEQILNALVGLKNDWEECFYQYLCRNFGFQINAMPFEMLARSLPLKLLRKEQGNNFIQESLVFGQAGLLEKKFDDDFPTDLQKEYQFLKTKYNLNPIAESTWKFMRMRPVNFPTIRLAQLIALMQNTGRLFAIARDMENVGEFFKLFNHEINPYWNDHYLFDKKSSSKSKRIGKASIENLIINTIIPFIYSWGIYTADNSYKLKAMKMLFELSVENNRIIEKWSDNGVKALNAGQSQALIHLKQYYCSEKKCLSCAIGKQLINTIT